MPVGPVQVMVIAFPGSQFNGEVGPALVDAVAQGDIRILDLVFISRVSDDEIEIAELEDLGDDEFGELLEAITGVDGLLSDADLDEIADALDVGSSAAAIVFEHAWAVRLSSAVRASNGQVVMDERIPADVVEAALQAARADQG
jgi:hypothetical protein